MPRSIDYREHVAGVVTGSGRCVLDQSETSAWLHAWHCRN
jgi:hypothetical protein